MERITRKSGDTTDEVASKTSLAGRVLSAINEGWKPNAESSWKPVQGNYAAWFRPFRVDTDEQVPVLLAMKFDLLAQLGLHIDGIANATAFRRAGENYGTFMEQPPTKANGMQVSDRLSGGRRLAILSPEVAAEILEQPDEDGR